MESYHITGVFLSFLLNFINYQDLNSGENGRNFPRKFIQSKLKVVNIVRKLSTIKTARNFSKCIPDDSDPPLSKFQPLKIIKWASQYLSVDH